MAFLSRVSNLLKTSGSKHDVSGCTASKASLFQAIRHMSSSKLFVGGISFQTDEMSLRDAFSQYGEVVEARLIMDRDTGRSRGFGFVTYASTESASSAIQALDGQDLQGRRIRVNYATERPRSPGFGGGYGGGNYGGQSGNYGGQSGNYGQGGYQGGGYPAGDGSYGGASGGYGGSNQYRSGGGGGYGGGNDYGSPVDGVGGNYGGGYGDANAPSVGGGSYTGGDPSFSANPTGFSSSLSDGPARADPVADIQDGSSDERSEYDVEKEEEDEPNDYANTRS